MREEHNPIGKPYVEWADRIKRAYADHDVVIMLPPWLRVADYKPNRVIVYVNADGTIWAVSPG